MPLDSVSHNREVQVIQTFAQGVVPCFQYPTDCTQIDIVLLAWFLDWNGLPSFTPQYLMDKA